MNLPIRVRLTAWYAALLALIIVGLGAFLVLQLRSDLRETIDTEILAASIRSTVHILEAAKIGADVATAPVATQGPLLERHARFARGVNAGFMQVVARDAIRLRVFERGAGETLACGTGACAAVAVGIRLGLLNAKVDVETRGGRLTIEWAGEASPVLMTGPAETVYEGEIEL